MRFLIFIGFFLLTQFTPTWGQSAPGSATPTTVDQAQLNACISQVLAGMDVVILSGALSEAEFADRRRALEGLCRNDQADASITLPAPDRGTSRSIWTDLIGDEILMEHREALAAKLAERIASEWRRDIALHEDQLEVFRAQRVRSWITTFVVHLILIVAIGISLFQFWIAYKHGQNVEVGPAVIKLGNVEIETSVFGFVLLVFAMGFYFLYLTYVYEIRPVPVS